MPTALFENPPSLPSSPSAAFASLLLTPSLAACQRTCSGAKVPTKLLEADGGARGQNVVVWLLEGVSFSGRQVHGACYY